MIEAAMIWNEPNNKSHWAFEHDPQWALFSEMAGLAATVQVRCCAARSSATASIMVRAPIWSLTLRLGGWSDSYRS